MALDPNNFDSQIFQPNHDVTIFDSRSLSSLCPPVRCQIDRDHLIEGPYQGSDVMSKDDNMSADMEQEQDSIEYCVIDTQFDDLEPASSSRQTQPTQPASISSVIEDTPFLNIVTDPDTQDVNAPVGDLSPSSLKAIMAPVVTSNLCRTPTDAAPMPFRRDDLVDSTETFKMRAHTKPTKDQYSLRHTKTADPAIANKNQTAITQSGSIQLLPSGPKFRATGSQYLNEAPLDQDQGSRSGNAPPQSLFPPAGLVVAETPSKYGRRGPEYVARALIEPPEAMRASPILIDNNLGPKPSNVEHAVEYGFQESVMWLEQPSAKFPEREIPTPGSRGSLVVTPKRAEQRKKTSESRKRLRQSFQATLSVASSNIISPRVQAVVETRANVESPRIHKPRNGSRIPLLDMATNIDPLHTSTINKFAKSEESMQQKESYFDQSEDAIKNAQSNLVSEDIRFYGDLNSLQQHNQNHEAAKPEDNSGPSALLIRGPNEQSYLETGVVRPEPTETQGMTTNINHVSRQSSMQVESRPVSSNSHPPSRRGSKSRSMNRPFPEEESIHIKALKPMSSHFNNPAKIQKSQAGPPQMDISLISDTTIASKSSPGSSPSRTLSGFQKFLKSGESFAADLERYEAQKVVIEANQAKLKNLENSNGESGTKIESLEVENQILTRKIKKLTGLCERYKTHMNDVVNSQKTLMQEAQKIRAETKAMGQESREISHELHQVWTTRVNQEQKLWDSLKDVKLALVASVKQEKEDAKEIANLKRSDHLHNKELEQRVAELGRERHNVAQCQKQLTTQSSSHAELVELVKSTQTKIVDELTKDGSLLSRVMSLESSTLAKIDELSPMINDLKDREVEISQPLRTLVEDAYDKIEKKLQATDSSYVSMQENNKKKLDDLNEGIDKVRLDQDTRSGLDECIAELRESNATLSAKLQSQETKCQGMTFRLDDVGRDLRSVRAQLTAKSDELVKHLVSPKDDPLLLSKLHNSESANCVLRGQLDTANQEINRWKADMQLLREESIPIQHQIRQLEDKLSSAHATINDAAEEKKAIIATSIANIEKARQEVARDAIAGRHDDTMRNDALVKNLERLRIEAESQLTTVQAELQKLQAENLGSVDQINSMQTEISNYHERIAAQATEINKLEMQIPSQEQLHKRDLNLTSMQSELAEYKAKNVVLQSEHGHYLAGAHRTQQEVVEQLRQVHMLETEKDELQKQIVDLQRKYNALNDSTTHHFTRTGGPRGHEAQETCAVDVPLHSIQKMGPPGLSSQAFRDRDSALLDNANTLPVTPSSLDIYPTPSEVLKSALDRRSMTPAAAMPGPHAGSIQKSPSTHTGSQSGMAAFRMSETIYNRSIWHAQPVTSSASQSSAVDAPRIAIRKSSNPAQHIAPQEHQNGNLSRTRSGKGDRGREIRQSTVTHTTHRTEETTVRIQSANDGPVPYATLHPVESHPSSSLSDVEPMVELLGFVGSQEDLDNAYRTSRETAAGAMSTTSCSSGQNIQGSEPTSSAHAQVARVLEYNDQSDQDEQSGSPSKHKSGKKVMPIAVKLPKHRAEPIRLKSALKKSIPKAHTNSAAVEHNAHYEASAGSKSTGPTLQRRNSGRVVGRFVTRPSMIDVGSNYNRVVSGNNGKPFNSVETQGYAQRPQHEVSPLIAAPERNNRKRMASTIGYGSHGKDLKRLKRNRPSYLPGTTIPESQEERYLH